VDTSVLLDKAERAMKSAYAPYSNFPVGSAVLAKSGKIYTGCNVENASLGLTICAERAAIARAICEGEREFHAVAVMSASDLRNTRLGQLRSSYLIVSNTRYFYHTR